MERYHSLRQLTGKILPYTYFIGLAAFWFLGDLLAIQHFSFIALGIILALTIQAVWQNKVIGTCLGIIAIVGSIIVFLATLSEFSDFETVTASAIQLLTVGSILSVCGFAMGLVLAATNMKELSN